MTVSFARAQMAVSPGWPLVPVKGHLVRRSVGGDGFLLPRRMGDPAALVVGVSPSVRPEPRLTAVRRDSGHMGRRSTRRHPFHNGAGANRRPLSLSPTYRACWRTLTKKPPGVEHSEGLDAPVACVRNGQAKLMWDRELSVGVTAGEGVAVL